MCSGLKLTAGIHMLLLRLWLRSVAVVQCHRLPIDGGASQPDPVVGIGGGLLEAYVTETASVAIAIAGAERIETRFNHGWPEFRCINHARDDKHNNGKAEGCQEHIHAQLHGGHVATAQAASIAVVRLVHCLNARPVLTRLHRRLVLLAGVAQRNANWSEQIVSKTS